MLAKYIAEVVEKGLENVKDNGGDISTQVALANRIITTIISETKEAAFDTLSVAERAEQLLALFDRKNNTLAINEKAEIVRPETSIAQSSLFTGAIHEPQMFTELKKEIVSCNRIDMLVSFIKWSGLRLIIEELGTFTTWHPDAYLYGREEHRIELMEELRNAGFHLELMEEYCEHYAIIDNEIVWYGSMNLLSKDDMEDNIMRVESKDIAVELLEMTFHKGNHLQEYRLPI